MENSFLINTVLIIGGMVSWLFLPSKINRFFGYRTRRSMMNLSNWKLANRLASMALVSLGLVGYLIIILLSSLGLGEEKHQNKIYLILIVLGLLTSIIIIEQRLKRKNLMEGGD